MNEKPEDILFEKTIRISKLEMDQDKNWAELASDKLLREHLAYTIEQAKVISTVGKDYYERRIEIYAASPAAFWAIVNKEAEKIAMKMGVIKESKND